MNNFTRILSEAKSNYSNSLTIQELDQYIDKTSRILPNIVKNALHLIKKYIILDPADIDEIISTSKSGLNKLASKHNISNSDMEDLWRILKDLKSNIKLFPHYLSNAERESLIKGKIKVSDITIDLDTPQGRKDLIEMYAPLVNKIINQYMGKSKLTRQDLMSAANMAFANAINDWDRSKGSTFKTYLSYRIQQQILNDMDMHGHSLSGTNWYATKKYGASMLDAVSIDGMSRNQDGEINNDRLIALGYEDDNIELDRDEEKQWKMLFNLIENKFKQRDVDIFYRYFGLHGYKREKSKDIAKDYKLSEGAIKNSVINKIIAYLKTDNRAVELLSNIQDLYNESLIVDLFGCDVNYINETLYNDDIFILLEELNKWNNKDVFRRAFEKATNNIDDPEVIINMMEGDFEDIDSNLKKERKNIILFLSNMYPTESMNRKTDIDILEYMLELQKFYKKYFKK